MVAPFTGAWIETALQGSQHLRMLVAPFTGAWIETCFSRRRNASCDGRPLHGGVD